jgi:Putative zinc-finger
VNCDDVRSKLTAYLDGELDDDRGSAIRGHMRGCDACRAMSDDEAALRDGLRALPPLDPPNALWMGIQQRLAAEEVADSKQSAWRRALSRFAVRWKPMAPQLAFGSAALAIAIAVLAVRSRSTTEPVAIAPPGPIAPADLLAPKQAAPPPAAELALAGDVTTELAADRTGRTSTYQHVVDGLVDDALDASKKWPDGHKQIFDAKLAAFRKDLDAAPEGRQRDKVYRSMIHYLQAAAIRDQVSTTSLADTRGVP